MLGLLEDLESGTHLVRKAVSLDGRHAQLAWHKQFKSVCLRRDDETTFATWTSCTAACGNAVGDSSKIRKKTGRCLARFQGDMVLLAMLRGHVSSACTFGSCFAKAGAGAFRVLTSGFRSITKPTEGQSVLLCERRSAARKEEGVTCLHSWGHLRSPPVDEEHRREQVGPEGRNCLH